MKVKTLGALVIAVAVLAVLAVVLFRPVDTTETKSALGQKLFEDLMVGNIEQVLITNSGGKVSLHRTEKGWVVSDRSGFPADFSRIAELVKKVQNLKIGRSFQASEEIQTRLALHPPEQSSAPGAGKGTRIRFEPAGGNALIDLVVGTTRQGGSGTGGQYVMPLGGHTIYLVDKTFKFLQTAPAEWLNRELLNIEADQVLRVAAFSAGSTKPLYTLGRSEQPGAEFELTPAPNSGELERAEIKRVVEALSPLRIEDVKSREMPLTGSNRFEYTLSDERRYTITWEEKKNVEEKTTVYQVQVDVAPPEQGNAPREAGPSSGAVQAETPDHQFARWIYLVSEWEIENFITDPLKFVSSSKE